MAHQGFEHGELARGQRQFFAIFLQCAQAHVKRERPECDDFLVARRRARHLGDGAAAQHGMNARQQLARVEGLGQVVVGADFEADDAVNVFAFGRQHDDGRAVVRCAQAPADGQAVFAGHHQVQHDQVYGVAQHDAVQRLAVFGQDDFKTLLSEIAAQQVADTGVVVKNQDLVGTGIGLSLGHDVLVICNRAILRAGNRECLFFYSKALLITIISIESK